MGRKKADHVENEEASAEAATPLNEDAPAEEPKEFIQPDEDVLLADPAAVEELRPEAMEGLPIQIEHAPSIVNEGTASDRMRADIQAALTRLASYGWEASNDVKTLRELFFGDPDMTT